MNDQIPMDNAEVGAASIWLLRGAVVVTSLVVLGFVVHATLGLFDDGEELDVSDDPVETEEMFYDDESTDETPLTSKAPPPSSKPIETTTSGTPASNADTELMAFVDEAMAFIEATRQRSFVERPGVEVVSVDAMTEIVLDDIREQLEADPTAAEASLAFARAIGFFAVTEDFLDIYDVFVSSGVLGVYFPTSDRLLVRSVGELTPSTKSTIVHELVHAFDDQHFDLGRDELADDGDVGWTFAAAIEGSASWVEQEWRATLTPAEASLLRDEELSFDPGGLFSLDLGFLIYQTSVYDAGRIWIDRLVAEVGITAIDDVLINGAPSSEVVSMPLNAANLDPIEVASPAVDGEVLWEGRGGRALIAALTFLTDPGQIAATGWGGDAITVYRDRNGSACLRWDVVGDTARDTNELFEELSRWGIGVGGTAGMVDGRVRIDRCA